MRSLQNGIILVAVLSVLLAGAWQVYRDPRVQDLFRTAAARPPRTRPAQAKPYPPAAPAAPSRPAKTASPGVNPQVSVPAEPEAPPPQRSPNEVVSRVLFQALGARKIAAGVSLEVTDSRIRVAGEVGSEGTRRQILDLVERASEGRSIDSTALSAVPPRDSP